MEHARRPAKTSASPVTNFRQLILRNGIFLLFLVCALAALATMICTLIFCKLANEALIFRSAILTAVGIVVAITRKYMAEKRGRTPS